MSTTSIETISGWGENQNTSREYENIPAMLNLPIHVNEGCFLTFPILVDISSRRTFCAGSATGKAACYGDNGGGLFIVARNVFYLKGILSASLVLNSRSDLNKYTVYINVPKFKAWIDFTKKSSLKGSRSS